MTIEATNYIQFFQGSCAESHIASLFQFAGFEVNKVTPDSGIDLIVSNIARSKFAREDAKSFFVQVKSCMMTKEKANFWLAEDELDFLCEGGNRFTAFAIFHRLQNELDSDDFDIYTDQIDKIIERDAQNFLEQIEKEKNIIKKNVKQSILDFTRYSLTIFWLNSKQMQRSRLDGFWKYHEAFKKWYLPVSTENGLLFVDTFTLIPALQDVRYMMIPSLSQENFDQGKFSHIHI